MGLRRKARTTHYENVIFMSRVRHSSLPILKVLLIYSVTKINVLEAMLEALLIKQFDISFLDISAYIGLAAVALMTCNLLMGLLVSTQYSTVTSWPYRRLPISKIHNVTGYTALLLVLAHPVWLLFAKVSNFTVLNLLVPVTLIHQPLENSLGAVALYLLIFVVITAYLRKRFAYAFWKKLHYTSYGVLVLFFAHSVLIDPNVHAAIPIDFLDGGKLFVYACTAISSFAILWRVTAGKRLRSLNQLESPKSVAAKPGWKGQLRLVAISDEAPGIRTFRFANPNGATLELPFSYRAGQYLGFDFNDGQRRFARSYSLSSSPHETHHCDISVKLIKNGLGSGYLHKQAKVGDLLGCSGPFGEFVFDEKKSRSILLLGGGVGVTPLMSLVRNLAANNWDGDVHLLYAFMTPQHQAFKHELEAIAAERANFKMLFLPTELAGQAWSGPHGLINTQILTNFVPNLRHSPVYLCGPAPMMTAAKALLKTLGVAAEQIHTEDFGGAVPSVSASDFVDATVKFKDKQNQLSLRAGGTLLQAAEEAGVLIESSCRVGTCGTCKVRLISGEVTMHRDDALSSKEISQGIILACQARCKSAEVLLETA